MTALVLAALSGILDVASGRGSAATDRHSQADRADPAVHVRTTFTVAIDARYATVFSLFGADKERLWAPGWEPRFLYPDAPEDRAGMVFTVEHPAGHSIWVNTAFDIRTGHVQYVYVVPGTLVTVIDIHLRRASAVRTEATVMYERTALVPEADDRVRSMAAHDKVSGPEWEAQIRDYLSKQ